MRRARPDELTDGAVHDYLVSSPSGSRFRLRGVFGIVSLGETGRPAIRTGTTLSVLDPRGVITRDGLVIYNLRRYPNRDADLNTWLVEHPEWPTVLLDAMEVGQ